RAAPAEAVLRWSAASLSVFTGLAADPASGVRLLPGTVVHRTPAPDVGWTAAVPGWRPAADDELPAGAAGGVCCTLPVVDMDRYLRRLEGACRDAGVAFRRERVAALADLPGDVVVVAAGLASGALLGDPTGVPVQG